MTCTATPDATEFDFVRAIHTRCRDVSACCGPILTLDMSLGRAFALEQIFDSEIASDLLWDGHDLAEPYGTTFCLCAGHWIDLATLLWFRSRQARRRDWFNEADQLLRDVCTAARWDVKEILNMFRWRNTRLT